MTRILDEKSSTLLSALTGKSQEFANEVSRVTEHAVKAIEAKGFTFTRTMMDNSEHDRAADQRGERSGDRRAQPLDQGDARRRPGRDRELDRRHQSRPQGAAGRRRGCRQGRGLDRHAHAARTAGEHPFGRRDSKQTAAAAVSEMLETHSMLRSDTTALFERLREANILLQEVLSGAHENMSEIESTLVTRVADFVAAMNEVAQQDRHHQRAGRAAHQQLPTGRARRRSPISAQLAAQFDTHGRSLAEAVSLIDRSNRRTEGALNERRESLETLIGMLDARAGELDNRLTRFSNQLDQSLTSLTAHRQQGRRSRAAPDALLGLLDQSLEAPATAPARSPAWWPNSTPPAHAPSRRISRAIRTANEDEHKRTTQAMRSDLRAVDRRRPIDVRSGCRALCRGGRRAQADDAEMQRELDSHARRAAQGHSRTAAGDRGKRRPDAPRDRRPDRGAGRAQPHRGAPWPQPRHRRAGGAARRARSMHAPPRREAVLANGGSRAEPPRPLGARAGHRCRRTPPPPPPPPRPAREVALAQPWHAPQRQRPQRLAVRPAHPRVAGQRAGAARAATREPAASRRRTRGAARASHASSRSTRWRSTSPA